MKLICVLMAVAFLPLMRVTTASAQDFQVQSVVAIDGKVNCLAYMKLTAQPCAEFTPPPKVAVGEKFFADGKTREIGVIRAHQAEDDMQAYGIKKGDWICVAAETLEDIPVDQSRDRIPRSLHRTPFPKYWLRIPKCQPDLVGSTPLLRQR